MKEFSPYHFSTELNGSDYKSGINWSYVSFDTKETATTFINGCAAYGYRTRNLHETDACKWAVQYHHYED